MRVEVGKVKACRCIGNGQAADRSSWRHTHLVVGLAAGVHERRTRTRKRAWSSPQIDSIRTGRSSSAKRLGVYPRRKAPVSARPEQRARFGETTKGAGVSSG